VSGIKDEPAELRCPLRGLRKATTLGANETEPLHDDDQKLWDNELDTQNSCMQLFKDAQDCGVVVRPLFFISSNRRISRDLDYGGFLTVGSQKAIKTSWEFTR